MGLRIAVLSRNFASTGGGAERYSMAIVEELSVRHDVHVFAQNIDHKHPNVSYHLVAAPLRRPRWINQLYFAAATWWATRKGFDVVHSHENSWHGQIQTVHVLPIKHTLFVGRRGLSLLLRWLKVATSPRLIAYLWLEKMRFAIHGKRRIVVTSNLLRKVMLSAYPQAQAAIELIAPGVVAVPGLCTEAQKQSSRHGLGLPELGTGLLFVGNDFRKKGLPALLLAMAEMPADVWLAVVGQSRQLDEMRHDARQLGVAARVHFLGALSNMDVAYCAADCLVHPTLEDTYAMVVLEAMAHGLPVIVSGAHYCGISEELEHGVQALVIDEPTSAPKLAAAIQRILAAPQIAAGLGARATEFARERTWLSAANQYEVLYESVAPQLRPRWLVLSHAFNMDGRAASQTITDKLPHLERAGIELVVLSGVSGRHDAHYQHHQLWPAAPAGIRFELRHVLRKRLGSGAAYRMVMVALSLPLLPFMLVEKLIRPVESSWSWWLSAYCKALWLSRTKKFDLIYSTGGAFAAHVAAMHLKKSLNVPWMAEVHDPLVTPGREDASDLTAQEEMQAKVERMICSHADIAIWFTDQALQSAKRRNPQLGDRGKMMIPGVDKPQLDLVPYVPTDKFVIGHFGSLSTTRNLSVVVHALELLLEDTPALKSVVQLHVYGGPLDPVSAKAVASSAVRECVHHFGRIENDPSTGASGRDQILQRMRSVDVLLLLHGEEPICSEYIPSKLYEYLWMGRPIMALVHGNPQMENMLRLSGHTVVPTATNPEAVSHIGNVVRASLKILFDKWSAEGLPDSARQSPYSTQAAVEAMLTWQRRRP